MVGLAFLYGVLKKFSRMSWLGYQAIIVFAFTFLLGSLPAENGTLLFSLAVGLVIGGAAIIFVLGILLRKPFLAMEKNGLGLSFLNRLLGGLGALVNLFAALGVIAALALVSLQGVGLEALDVVYSNAIWTDFLGPHALDFVIVYVFVALLQSGYRAGFFRMILNVIVVGLVFLSVFLAMYMVLQVPFLNDFSHFIGSSFVESVGNIGANWIGFAIASFIVAFVFLIITVIVGVLLNLFLKFLGKFRITVALNGALGFTVMAVLLIGIVLGFNCGVAFLAGDSLAQALPAEMQEMANAVKEYGRLAGDFLSSSPLSNIFYNYNPLRALVG